MSTTTDPVAGNGGNLGPYGLDENPVIETGATALENDLGYGDVTGTMAAAVRPERRAAAVGLEITGLPPVPKGPLGVKLSDQAELDAAIAVIRKELDELLAKQQPGILPDEDLVPDLGGDEYWHDRAQATEALTRSLSQSHIALGDMIHVLGGDRYAPDMAAEAAKALGVLRQLKMNWDAQQDVLAAQAATEALEAKRAEEDEN